MKTKRDSSIIVEMRKIQRAYCTKCIHFKDGKCSTNQIAKKCFKRNGRVKGKERI